VGHTFLKPRPAAGFAFLALIPLPPILVMGIMILIIWHYHKQDLLARDRRAL